MVDMSGIKLPRHEASLTLCHNDHKDMYESVAEFTKDMDSPWVSVEQKVKAIATNELWSIQWYPDTPIGFYTLLACDLDVLLKEACRIQDEADGLSS